MLRTLVLLLTVVTGATGLVYEVVWQKYLATLLGSHSEATSAVLGLFLAGLSIGYRLFGTVAGRVVRRAQRAGRVPRLLPLYAMVEAGIGIYALCYPWFFSAVQSVSLQLPQSSPGAGFAVDVGLAALLILPPTILMGGTVPLLTQGLSRDLEDATHFHALVYGFNTAGAFFGACASGFFLIPWLGLHGVMYAAGVVNIVAGVVLGVLGRRSEAEALADAEPPGPRPPGWWVYVAVALLTGFAMMGVQTVANRVGALALGSSPFTFSLVAALFVSCIAAGSFAVSALKQIPTRLLLLNQAALLTCLIFLDGFLPNSPFWAHVLRTTFSQTNLAFYGFYAAAFLGMLLVIGPAAFCSGATLPLLFHELKRDAGDLGSTAGSLYAWNTFGSLLGALGIGYFLLFWLDLSDVYRLSVVAVFSTVVLLAPRILEVPRWMPAAAVVAVVSVLAIAEPWNTTRLNSGLFRLRSPLEDLNPYSPESVTQRTMGTMVEATDDPVTSVAVLDRKELDGQISRSIRTNGKSDGSSIGDYPTMSLAALIPALIAEKLDRAFVIGWGTGITVGELAALEDVKEITVAEISPGVMQMDKWFEEVNLGARASEKVRVDRSDAYRSLLRAEGEYDLIVSEPSNPWMAGVEMLFSHEFLTSARDRLAPGGVYVQWMHQYEMDEAALELVLRTYDEVFPEVSIWFGTGPDLLLLGFPEAGRSIDVAQIEERVARSDIAAGLERSGIASTAALMAHELWPTGVLKSLALDGPVHTLFHPRLNHVAAHAFFQGRSAKLPFSGFKAAGEIGRRNSTFRRWRSRRRGLSDAEWHAFVAEACDKRRAQCAGWVTEWRVALPDSPLLDEFVVSLGVEQPWFGKGTLPEITLLDLFALRSGRLFEGSAPDPMDAVYATDLYEAFFTHGAGLLPSRLTQVWRRCEDGHHAPDSCRRGLAEVSELLRVNRAGLGEAGLYFR